MADILPFDFETNAVRVVLRDGAPWFVAADVCRVLEISKHRDAVARLDDDERGSVLVDTLGGQQSMAAVDESGLFALILTSRKPAAKRFRKWVTAEVLPALRRDGFYGLPAEDRAELEGKRSYYAQLPEAQRRARALEIMQEAIDSGANVTQAVEVAAEEMGMGARTVWSYRRAVYMVPRRDWEAALAPRWKGRRTMRVNCHPEIMRHFLEFAATGARGSDCYRRVVQLAEENGWGNVPSSRTMYRALNRFFPKDTRRLH